MERLTNAASELSMAADAGSEEDLEPEVNAAAPGGVPGRRSEFKANAEDLSGKGFDAARGDVEDAKAQVIAAPDSIINIPCT